MPGGGDGGRPGSKEVPRLVQSLPCGMPLLRNWRHRARGERLGLGLVWADRIPNQDRWVRLRFERWRLTSIRTVEWSEHHPRARFGLYDIMVLGGRRDPPCDIGLEVVEVADGHLWLG